MLEDDRFVGGEIHDEPIREPDPPAKVAIGEDSASIFEIRFELRDPSGRPDLHLADRRLCVVKLDPEIPDEPSERLALFEPRFELLDPPPVGIALSPKLGELFFDRAH